MPPRWPGQSGGPLIPERAGVAHACRGRTPWPWRRRAARPCRAPRAGVPRGPRGHSRTLQQMCSKRLGRPYDRMGRLELTSPHSVFPRPNPSPNRLWRVAPAFPSRRGGGRCARAVRGLAGSSAARRAPPLAARSGIEPDRGGPLPSPASARADAHFPDRCCDDLPIPEYFADHRMHALV